MWIATVANIDWPSRPGMSTGEQQQEIRQIVATGKRLRMNALILQVRPGADALYASALEPWTEYLSGEQGRPPEPLYDPLAMWISEAHASGLELHAWFNPFRARHAAAKSLPAADHITNTHPHVAKTYGEQYWMDPGEPDAAQRLLDVIGDVLRRYDVDGVHIDDYFYPYPVKLASDQPEIDFPDEPSWQRYLITGGKLGHADWRRNNIDRLVQTMHAAIHSEKPWVKFGISPFGLGRPDRRPDGITGFSQYDKLYADVEHWLQEGWLDYLAPQLYWPIAQAAQSFPALLAYWSRANSKGRHLWPGLFTSKIDESAASWQPDEVRAQINLLRRDAGAESRAGGHIHFSAIALTQNRKGIADLLERDVYPTDALVPATPWLRPLDVPLPSAPLAVLRCANPSDTHAQDICIVEVKDAPRGAISILAIWAKYGAHWKFTTASASAGAIRLPARANTGSLEQIVISAIDRYGVEGVRTTFVRP